MKTDLDSASVDFFALVAELGRHRFNGYFAICTSGEGGFEEGTMVFDDGKPVASFYEYYAYRRQYVGEEAFKRVLNAFSNVTGVVDILELSNEQVRLLLAFNERAIMVPAAKDLEPRAVPFSQAFEAEAKSSVVPLTKQELLKKYRLAEIERKPAGEQVHSLALDGGDPLKPLFSEG